MIICFYWGTAWAALVYAGLICCTIRLASRGTIISSPALERSEAPALFVWLAKLLNLVVPRLLLPSPLDTSAISRDPQAVQAYLDDPLVYGKVSPRWVVSIFETIDRVHTQAANFSVPLLMTHGQADTIVPIGGTQRFFAEVRLEEKQLITYPQTRHEPHNDINHQEVVSNIVQWLDSRLLMDG